MRVGGLLLRPVVGLGLAILATICALGTGARAQAIDPEPIDPALERALEQLSPEERIRILESIRSQPANTQEEEAGSSSSPVLPDDTLFAPRPLGGRPDSVVAETPADTLGVERETEVEVRRFGEDLFRLAPRTYQPPTYGPVPEDYRLGPGDEVIVEVWGEVTFRDTHLVDRRGSILLRDAGQTTVANLTLAQAQEEITRRMARVLSGVKPSGGGTTFVDVSLGRLRAIRVFVIGEASRPGGYEVSSVATVFQALYVAGGPNEIGSMRDVRLIRDNRVVTRLDLYDYLLRGLRQGDATLRDGDTVFIPVAQRTVTIRGQVRRPAVFELKEGEGLRDVIRFAGGLLPSARADMAHVRRILPPDERTDARRVRVDLDLSLAGSFEPSAPLQALRDGDRIEVLAVTKREEAFVIAGGSVVSPGRYGYEPGMRLTDLLARARGTWHDAILERAVLIRVQDDSSRESFRVDLTRLSPGGSDDIVLSPMDSLHVFSETVLLGERAVEIHGQVRQPGVYEHFENMTLRDLVLAAGGMLEAADSTVAEVSRPLLDGDSEGRPLARVMSVTLGRGASSPEAGSFVLANHDHVFVRKDPGFELQRNVRVEGEVMRPGTYTLIHREERLSSVIERAGGLLESAYAPGFRLHRRRDDIGTIGLDLKDALERRGGSNDIILMAGDEITVPSRPMSVRVVGEVGYPTSVVFERGKSVRHYVDNAGGVTETADRGRTKVIYPNGLSKKVKRLWPDPEVLPGSTIYVPAKDPQAGIEWGSVIVGTTQVLASLATIYLVIDTASR